MESRHWTSRAPRTRQAKAEAEAEICAKEQAHEQGAFIAARASEGPLTVYLWLKLLHLAAVIAFLGNITTGLFWHAHAARTRDPRLLAHAVDGIIRSDRLFTIPGVVIIIVGGVATAIVGGYPILGTTWILWSLILFAVSGLVFVIRVAPLQVRLRALAQAGVAQGSFDWAGYQRLAHTWERWGAIALLTPVAALVLMVLKPNL